MFYRLLFASLWYILPAYVANASACIFGGGTPVDLGKNFIDGRRLIGNGVTYRGCVFGIICGTLIGLIQGILVDFNIFNSNWLFYFYDCHFCCIMYWNFFVRN